MHGDFNISNILFGSIGQVSGVLDFAEFCRGFVEEDIISLSSELPVLESAIIHAYEEETGYRSDPRLIMLAKAKRAFIGMMIARNRAERTQEGYEDEEFLRQTLPQLRL